MQTSPTFTVSFGNPGNLAVINCTKELPWPELVELLSTAKECADKSGAGWYLAGRCREPHRNAKNLEYRSALTLDIDKAAPGDVEKIRVALKPWRHVLHTTASHKPDAPRLRAVVPTARPMTAAEYQATSQWLAEQIGGGLVADESHKPCQMMFLPTCKPGNEFWSTSNDGDLLPVVAGNAPEGKAGEPLEEIAAFNKAYSIHDAIREFALPYESVSQDRYTFTRGSTVGGAVVYDDGSKLFSNHGSDPARDFLRDAFDLVRVHKFVDGASSYKSMIDYARKLPRVKDKLPAEYFKNLDASATEDSADNEIFKRWLQSRFLRYSDLLRLPPLEYVGVHYFLRRAVALWQGAPGGFKTLLLILLAARFAISKPLLERLPAADPRREVITPGGKVCFVSFEDAPVSVRWRIDQARSEMSAADRATFDANFTLLDLSRSGFELITAAGQGARATPRLDTFCESLTCAGQTPDLLIFDNLSRLSSAEENSNAAMATVIKTLERIADRVGCAVVLVHHVGQVSARMKSTDMFSGRGATSLPGGTRSVVTQTFDSVTREVTVTHSKHNDNRGVQNVYFSVDDDGRLSQVAAGVRDLPQVEPPVIALCRWWLAAGGAPLSRHALTRRNRRDIWGASGLSVTAANALLDDELASGLIVPHGPRFALNAPAARKRIDEHSLAWLAS